MLINSDGFPLFLNEGYNMNCVYISCHDCHIFTNILRKANLAQDHDFSLTDTEYNFPERYYRLYSPAKLNIVS